MFKSLVPLSTKARADSNYRNRSGPVPSEIVSQKFAGNTAVQKNFNEIRENLKKPSNF